MSASQLGAWLEGGADDFVWIEFDAYAHRVFAGAGDDWLRDPVRYASTLIQAQGVIPTRCLSVDIAAPFVAGLAAAPREADDVVAALGAEPAAAFVDAALDALLHRFAGRLDLFLKIPSPHDLLNGGDAGAAIDFDALDDVASALTARLRACAGKAIAGVLLEKARGTAVGEDEADACEPLLGAARHYDWLTALAFGSVSDGEANPGALDVDLLLLPATPLPALPAGDAAPRIGGGLDAAFWAGGASVTGSGRLLYGVIPAAAEPETVLSVLRALAA